MEADVIPLNQGIRHLIRATRAFAEVCQDEFADEAVAILEGARADELPISFVEIPADDERLDDYLVRVVLHRNRRPGGSVVAVQVLVAADVPEDIWLGAYGILAGLTIRNILVSRAFHASGMARGDTPMSLMMTRAMSQEAALYVLARLFADQELISLASIRVFRDEQNSPKPCDGVEALRFLDWSLQAGHGNARLPRPADNVRVAAGVLMAFFLSVTVRRGDQAISAYALDG